MKTIISYECEICGNRHTDKAQIEQCEAQGKQKSPPIGLIFGNCLRGAFYEGITFCVATVDAERRSHCVSVGMWAARDNGAGDNYGDELCGGPSFHLTGQDVPNPNSATFKRMVKWITENRPDLKITVWSGIAPVPLKTFLKDHKAGLYEKAKTR